MSSSQPSDTLRGYIRVGGLHRKESGTRNLSARKNESSLEESKILAKDSFSSSVLR